jgi:CRP-like cAMP-binding protein
MALTDCLLAALPREHFLALLENHSSISLKVMKSLAGIVRTSTDRIMDLSTLAANNRVQADLLRLARNHVDDGNRAEISPIPMHSDIASRASTTRETVARVLNDLARRDVVERQKEILVVLDVELLSNMVEEVRGE